MGIWQKGSRDWNHVMGHPCWNRPKQTCQILGNKLKLLIVLLENMEFLVHFVQVRIWHEIKGIANVHLFPLLSRYMYFLFYLSNDALIIFQNPARFANLDFRCDDWFLLKFSILHLAHFGIRLFNSVPFSTHSMFFTSPMKFFAYIDVWRLD